MNHTKTALIAILFIAGVYSGCTDNPLKPSSPVAENWETTDAGRVAPDTLTFCKALKGKNICLTDKGMTAYKKAFDAKKAAFKAARDAHLARWMKMENDFASNIEKMFDTVADIGAEANSTMRLMVRMYANLVNQWDCGFYTEAPADGSKTVGELNMDSCKNLPNVTQWYMDKGYENLKKTTLKKIINIVLTMQKLEKMANPDTPMARRFLQANTIDINTLEGINAFVNMTDKARYEFYQNNKGQFAEVNFKDARIEIRKMLKPYMITMFNDTRQVKLDTFKAQRMCFVKLLKAEASFKCQAAAASNGVKTVDGKKVMYVMANDMKDIRQVCYDYVSQNVELGKSWEEGQIMLFEFDRYPAYKKLWIKMKSIVTKLSKSKLSFNDLINILLDGLFDDEGLYDQMIAFVLEEQQALIDRVKSTKAWEMDFSKDDATCNENSCDKLKTWFSAKDGVSIDAASMKQFRPDVNETNFDDLQEMNDNLKFLKLYLEVFNNETANAQKIIDDMDNGKTFAEVIAELMNDGQPQPVTPTRMLEETDITIMEVSQGETGFDTAVSVSTDNQVSDEDVAVEVIDQSENTDLNNAVDNLSEEDDAGQIGDNSDTDTLGDSDDSWSLMTWLMVVFGALFVLTLVAGGVYVCMQRKDAGDFEHTNTEMGTNQYA